MFSTDSTDTDSAETPRASARTSLDEPRPAPDGEWGYLVTADGRVVLVDADRRSCEDRSAA